MLMVYIVVKIIKMLLRCHKKGNISYIHII